MQKKSLRILCESAVMIALSAILSIIKVYQAPYGGSVTLLSMAPMILLSLRWGVKTGLFAGLAYSLVQLLLGLNNIGYIPSAGGMLIAIAFDYLLPFTLLGLAGCFRNIRFSKNRKLNLLIAAVLGTLLVTILRYACHVVSGAVLWYSLSLEQDWYVDDPQHIIFRYSAWMYSLVYNGSFMVPEIAATTVGVGLLAGSPVKKYLFTP